MTGRPALVSAVARGDTEVFEISPNDLRRIMSERPALGELLLRAFIARRELLVASDFQGLRVLGAGSSRDTFRIRDFLARNQVPFTWIDTEHDPQVGALLHSFGLTEADTPVVVFGSEPLLRNPTTRALADLIGVKKPLAQRVYDLVIVGGGPAGLAAAVYASSEGLATAVIDASAPGGQAGTSSKIENYLGFPTGISGAELANRAILQAQKFGAQFSSPSQAARLEFEKGQTLVWFDSEHVSTRCVLIATGAEYRKLDVPKREQFEGLGVYYAATPTELQLCRGAEVIVVGGGNSAGQAVMFLSESDPARVPAAPRRRPEKEHVQLSGGSHRGRRQHRGTGRGGDLPHDGRPVVGGRRDQEPPHWRDANRPDPCSVYLYRRDSLHQLAAR